jgi:hypothetical protein
MVGLDCAMRLTGRMDIVFPLSLSWLRGLGADVGIARGL